MVRVLSIDWDFFINASESQRNDLFPDSGNEYLSQYLQDYVWKSRYAYSPNLDLIGTKDLDSLHELLGNFIKEDQHHHDLRTLFTDSHRHIYDFIMGVTDLEDQIEVYNIDHHHDLYHYQVSGERVNCGSWGTALKEDRPNCKMFWTKNADSVTFDITGDRVDAKYKSFSELNKITFDYLFMCKSGMWSPPHLDKEFIKILNLVKDTIPVSYEEQLLVERECYHGRY